MTSIYVNVRRTFTKFNAIVCIFTKQFTLIQSKRNTFLLSQLSTSKFLKSYCLTTGHLKISCTLSFGSTHSRWSGQSENNTFERIVEYLLLVNMNSKFSMVKN